MAQATLCSIPENMRAKLAEVLLRIEEFATEEQLKSVDRDDPWQLTGIYEGRPLTEQSLWDPEILPPTITLFRQPLLLELHETGVEFEQLVRHVVIHEAGHHFGFSDDEMHWLEAQAS